MLTELLDRVNRHTTPGEPDACWTWTASVLPNGRPRLGVRTEGRNTSVTVARVIAAARDQLPLFSAGHRWVARHSCDNLGCVNPAHILSGTYAENTADMWTRDRGARGDRRPSAVLSVEKVREIRALGPTLTQSEIGARYGVSQSHISQVLRGVIWGWVE